MKNHMTIVIQLPCDEEKRSEIVHMLSVGNAYHGGLVTAVSSEDEITRIERYESLYGDLPPETEMPTV